ncbi:MAG: hypothetical protein LC745_06115, partial [Planctomycetia bacterium]|nr:hypothetical protein [Planctomycetia bacterium]
VPALLDRLSARRGESPGVRSENLTAFRPTALDPPARVVFLTAIDTPPPLLPGRRRSSAASALVIASVVVVVVNLALGFLASGPPRPALVVGWSAFEIALIVWLGSRLRPSSSDAGLDNSDGLALLVELARTWPRRTDADVETRFVAAGGVSIDGAGMKALDREIRTRWPPKPTLLVVLLAPGIGRRLTLASPGLADLAKKAADSLWVPNRVAPSTSLWNDLGLPGFDRDLVGIFGTVEGSARPSVDFGSLQRAGQLATEIAMRWVKQTAATGTGHRGIGRNP